MWRIALTYIGALVGAGFASGQELVTFFVSFGPKGFWGIGLITLLFAISGVLILYMSKKMSCKSSQQMLAILFPGKLAKVMTFLLNAALWLGLVVMIIGSCTLLEQLLAIPKWMSFPLIIFAIYLPLQHGGDGFLAVNQYLIPVLLMIAVAICLRFLNQPVACIMSLNTDMLLPNWGVAALLYWLYNMLLAMVVLVGIHHKPGAFSGVIVGAGILGALAFLLCVCLSLVPSDLQQGQLPMLDLAFLLGNNSGWLYAVVMMIAMYTTAIANGYGLVVNYEQSFLKRKPLLLLMLLPTMLFIPFDFAVLVGIVYPMLGYLSIPMMGVLVVKAIKP